MKSQKPKRSKWFSLVVGGIAFMVLAGTAAEARKFVMDYQANPRGYLVAVNNATQRIQLIRKTIIDVEAQQREKMMKKHNLNLNSISQGGKYQLKARVKNKRGGLVLEMTLYKEGVPRDKTETQLSAPGAGPGEQCNTLSGNSQGVCGTGWKCNVSIHHKTWFPQAYRSVTLGIGICVAK